MRFDRQVKYPHPVLRPGVRDYSSGDFQVVLGYKVSEDHANVEIRARYDLTVDTLVNLIEDDRACVGLLVSSRDTFFQKIIELPLNAEQVVSIDGGKLHGEIRIVPVVYATRDVQEFWSPDFVDEFAGLEFSLQAGDFLAYDTPQTIRVDRAVLRPIESFITLSVTDSQEGYEWGVTLDDDYIDIRVSIELGNAIQEARSAKGYEVVLTNSIYFSAVQSAVEYLREDSGVDTKWANVIRHGAIAEGIGDVRNEEPHLVAQRLLGHPIERLVNSAVHRGGGTGTARLLTPECVNTLKGTIGANLERYRSGNFSDMLDSFTIDVDLDYDLLSRIKFPEEGSSRDIDNCKLVGLACGKLTPFAARDERLWAQLCHGPLLEYARARWPIPWEGPKAIKHIESHFFAPDKRSLDARNAVSRLYWLNHVAARVDELPLEETLSLILHNQDIRSNLVERPTVLQIKTVLVAVVQSLKRSREGDGRLCNRANFRRFQTRLNEYCSHVFVESLPAHRVQRIVDRMVEDTLSDAPDAM